MEKGQQTATELSPLILSWCKFVYFLSLLNVMIPSSLELRLGKEGPIESNMKWTY